jgi:hypothetical protein
VLAYLQGHPTVPVETKDAKRNQILAAEREVLWRAKEWKSLHYHASTLTVKPLQDAIDTLVELQEEK